MRPKSILQFERLYLAAIVISLIATALSWGDGVAAMQSNPATRDMGPSVLLVAAILLHGAMVLLWWLVARRGSVIAKWVIALWFVLSTVMLALALFRGGFGFDLGALLGWAVYLLRAWSVSYLFRPDAEAWLAGAPDDASAEA